MTTSKTPRDTETETSAAKSSKKVTEGINLARSAELAREIREFRRRGMFATLLFTTAQNATPVHTQFLAAIESYLEHRHGKLYVIPIRYKNPTSHWSQVAKSHDWWAPEIEDYLLTERVIQSESHGTGRHSHAADCRFAALGL